MQPIAKTRNMRSRDQNGEAMRPKIATYFHVECSVCGRQLRVLVEYLGQRVACGHCGGCFVANDTTKNLAAAPSILEQADRFLTRSSHLPSRTVE